MTCGWPGGSGTPPPRRRSPPWRRCCPPGCSWWPGSTPTWAPTTCPRSWTTTGTRSRGDGHQAEGAPQAPPPAPHPARDQPRPGPRGQPGAVLRCPRPRRGRDVPDGRRAAPRPPGQQQPPRRDRLPPEDMRAMRATRAMTAAARTLIGGAARAGGLAPRAPPPNDAPRFTCPASAECTFTGDHLNGPVPLTIPVGGHGLQPGAPWDPLDGKGAHAGSLRNRWGGDTWVKNRQAGRVKCIKAGGWASLGHNYGVAVTLSAGNSRGCREHAPGF